METRLERALILDTKETNAPPGVAPGNIWCGTDGTYWITNSRTKMERLPHKSRHNTRGWYMTFEYMEDVNMSDEEKVMFKLKWSI